MLRTAAALCTLFATVGWAAVTRVEVSERADLPVAGFERVAGKLHFALDPKLAANKTIVDLALAPKDSKGLVEFAADFLVLRPTDPAKSNGTALLEIVNRGRPQMWGMLNTGANANMRAAADFGDNFLLQQGYTVILVGWQWDVAERAGNFKVYAPVVPNVTGPVRMEMIPNAKQVMDALPYPLADPKSGTMTVRDAAYGPRTAVAKSKWHYTADHTGIEIPEGLTPGRIYEFVYTAKNPVVTGAGMAAVRDYISYVKTSGIAPGIGAGEIKRALAVGNSQSGRLLRTFVSEGFNADEGGKQVFEGVWAQVAGAGNGGFNQRFVQPGRTTGQYTGSFYPTDESPFTPAELLKKATEQGVAPKLVLTNGSHEYFGRAAALNHFQDGKDVDPPANVRYYWVAGTQHGGGGGGANPNMQNLTNSMEWTYFLRATLVSLNTWITNGAVPPASVYPRVDQGQAVPFAKWTFPKIPGFAVVKYVYEPHLLNFGPHFAQGIVSIEPPKAVKAFPVVVPVVNADGNETAGIRLPDLRVPLATHTGWNLRHPNVGSPDQQYSLTGSQIGFARTRADRERTGDPRPSISERYSSKQDYLSKIDAAAKDLVAQRFLLEADVPRVVALAGRHWDQAMGASK